ncbi:MAG: 30S ribosomal protein S17 [Candidatus Nanohalarchaeota archaeon]|nr:MAG: 30S ribosomal protein S17 [Candidatus Nanohaloarchaeota archaeon]
MKIKNIGIPTKNKPKEECSDKNCPFHGSLKVRGRTFLGTIISEKMDSSVIVSWSYTTSLPKYERLMRNNSKIAAHIPPCIHAKKGDKVLISECRPLSKKKSFVVIEKTE